MKAVRILAKGYLTNFSNKPCTNDRKIINSVKENPNQKANPDYDIVIKRLHLYYNMKTSLLFGIDKDRNFNNTIFPIFLYSHIHNKPLILYQLENSPQFPIIDEQS